ncbi:MAG: SMP-30/gluconolactonase/LRE family protein, partial [Myxococcales bacterium]|nr:SMP-30/gluconolactonase/LRE family protein [Myxococcales bacterium]
VFFRTDEMVGRVDGATVDRDGNYWCAMIHDGSVCCFTPDGKLERRIELPVKHPTMCSFGGDGLDVLYVVTGRRFLDDAGRAGQPLAGSLFAITDTGAEGLAEPFFAGK